METVSLKCSQQIVNQHGVMSQKTLIFTNNAVKTSDHTCCKLFFFCRNVLTSMAMAISQWMKTAQINTAAGVGKGVCCTAVHCAPMLSARYANALTELIFNFSSKEVEEMKKSYN
jgi:hypothetical protein